MATRHFTRWTEETKIVPLRLPRSLYEHVTSIAKQLDIATSTLMRQWIEEEIAWYAYAKETTVQLKKIKVGHWYETRLGVGRCERAGGTFPVSCQINITTPFPRGLCNMPPRDVLAEVPAPPSRVDEKGEPDAQG